MPIFDLAPCLDLRVYFHLRGERSLFGADPTVYEREGDDQRFGRVCCTFSRCACVSLMFAIDNEEEGSGGRDEENRDEPASCHISMDSITESSAAMVSAD
jgi:hypothetical protein